MIRSASSRSATVPYGARVASASPPSMRVTGSPRSSAIRAPASTGAFPAAETRSAPPRASPAARRESATVPAEGAAPTRPSIETVTDPRAVCAAGSDADTRSIPRRLQVPSATTHVSAARRPRRRASASANGCNVSPSLPTPTCNSAWRRHAYQIGDAEKSSEEGPSPVLAALSG